jgi:hypothetical protein
MANGNYGHSINVGRERFRLIFMIIIHTPSISQKQNMAVRFGLLGLRLLGFFYGHFS